MGTRFTESLFSRAKKFVENEGKKPMFLPGRVALKADEKPDKYGKLTISLWAVNDAHQLEFKIREVTHWYCYQNKFINLFNATDIITFVMKYIR
ncbi:hypothetical protein WOSG25_110380 [Weissella oryzae SG25]|uniref:Uncharacterized protein n=1 Tax=Weissella oryzae (strain DSM 25784 / JCM 18191 / LMG 30913 / SG25) TaxID=1329250 RepID=A0A069CUS6_WEIOS|nr:hypothetical protein [Weissella oryzae]GAK31560.1 hypothetical protein WOSG25_110380 [Weissella oryzae SG25]